MNVSLIKNQINIEHLDQYAAIIGESPSKGARSPKLWNAVFEKQKINSRMVPLDVKSNNIIKLLNELSSDPKFMGGAIAVPYKEIVAKWLNKRITKEAEKIGAVNCLYRNKNGELYGTNTDGEAAIKTFEDEFGSVKGKSVTILGCGGSGKGVAAYFSEAVSDGGNIIIISRKEHDKDYAEKIGSKWGNWSNINDALRDCDILINSTSIGFGRQERNSPLRQEKISLLKKNSIIFDVIYQPLKTELLKIADQQERNFMNGLKMNLEQAILAFQYNTDIEMDVIRESMEGVN